MAVDIPDKKSGAFAELQREVTKLTARLKRAEGKLKTLDTLIGKPADAPDWIREELGNDNSSYPRCN